jgi:MoaA/NifB/PqqE/SkfB family radical SAM enzyme
MIQYENIRSVHLEISTRCNASCPECPRNFRGVNNIIDTYPLTDMSLDQFQKIFPRDFISQLNEFYINGNHGDFVTARDGLNIVKYIKQVNPKIYLKISTNASARPEIWSELGALKIEVLFRIDGLKDTHHLYRLNTDYDLIIDNARKFISAGGRAIWAMIKFDHNKHQIEACRQISKSLGFKDFLLVDVGRDTFPVFKSNKTLSHIVGDYKGSTDFDELYHQYQYYKIEPKYSIKSETSNREIDCFSTKNKQIYVCANGEVYPCCWLGFYPLQSLASPSNTQLQPIIFKNNALEYDLKETIEWFSAIENSWAKENAMAGKIYTCNQVCGKE